MAIIYQNGKAGKICANPECGWKPLSEFHPRRLLGLPTGDGYKSRCKDCFNAQKREERAAKTEQSKETARKYVEANKEHIRNLKRSHQQANPERYPRLIENGKRHIAKKLIQKHVNEDKKISNTIVKSGEIHTNVTQKNAANILLSITNSIQKNQLQQPIAVAL